MRHHSMHQRNLTKLQPAIWAAREEEEDGEEESDNMLCQLGERERLVSGYGSLPDSVKWWAQLMPMSRDSDNPQNLHDAPQLALILVIWH